MNEFWMAIALVLTGCVVIVAYYLAMMLKELMENLREMKNVVRNANTISENVIEQQEMISGTINSVYEMVEGVEEGISTIKDQLLTPLSFIANLLQSLLMSLNLGRRFGGEEEIEEDKVEKKTKRKAKRQKVNNN